MAFFLKLRKVETLPKHFTKGELAVVAKADKATVTARVIIAVTKRSPDGGDVNVILRQPLAPGWDGRNYTILANRLNALIHGVNITGPDIAALRKPPTVRSVLNLVWGRLNSSRKIAKLE